MSRFCQVAFSQGSVPVLTLDEANELRSQLVRWYEALPPSLHATAIVLPGQLQLQ